MEARMVNEIRQIAIFVANLEEAEAYYRKLFSMELIGREAQLSDGLWYSLPQDKGWEDAKEAGIKLGMVAIKNGALVLALFPGKPQPGQLYIVGLNMNQKEIPQVRAQLPEEAEVWEDDTDSLTFRDRYGIIWQIYPTGTVFRTSGEIQGRWLKV
jgi:catechol 2,3-dioxygenase-like lactoylglutathione lyase family enzyme